MTASSRHIGLQTILWYLYFRNME